MAQINFGQALKKARKTAGLTQKDVYEVLGVPQSTFSSWEIGKSEPDANTLIKLCAMYGIDRFSELGVEAGTSRRAHVGPTPTKQIPLLGEIAAGSPIFAEENIEEYLTVDADDDGTFALRVQGDSMTGVGIYDGDIIYVREQPTVNNGEIAVVLIHDGFPESSEATVKRFYQYGKTVVLRPESHNPEHKDREITLGKDWHVSIQGKVIFTKGFIEGR